MTALAKRVQDIMVGNKVASLLAVLLTVVIVSRQITGAWDPRAVFNEVYVWFVTVMAPYFLYRRLRNHFKPLDQKGEHLLFAMLCLGYAMFVFVIVQPF